MADRDLEEIFLQSQKRTVWDVPSDHEMPIAERILWKVGLYGPVLAIPVLMFAWSPFSVSQTAVHYLSATGCQVAAYVGTAEAKEGEPGYHRRLDDDKDGVACEPEVERSFSSSGGARFIRP